MILFWVLTKSNTYLYIPYVYFNVCIQKITPVTLVSLKDKNNERIHVLLIIHTVCRHIVESKSSWTKLEFSN